ncbi:cytochrome P450 [Phormidium tenue FACHB-886]|nr:cytochrome P450 [Phormidium tenue FACHB-886]
MNRPPSSQTPALWNLLRWIIQPIEYLDECAHRYGDCFALDFGTSHPFVFFNDPKAVEQLFTAPIGSFDSGRANWILRRTLGDNSLLLLDGERHQRQRQLIMPPFHGERMRAYGEIICQITERVTQQWKPGVPFSVRPAMQEISLRVIMQAVFGLAEGDHPQTDRYEQLKSVLDNFLKLTASRFGFAMGLFPLLQKDLGPWTPGAKFNRMKQEIDTLLYAEIQERRANFDPQRSDILNLLLSAQDETGQSMTDEELRDELITLLLAGHETTATALSWALYWIHQLPDVREKVLAELQALGSDPEPLAIARAPYLSAVCAETLRIYPVALITEIRIAKASVQVMGYDFEPETMLTPCIYLIHQREDLYPNPRQFKPERFLERQYSPYEYLPFGGSNRRCIGAAFALFEMKLALATILTNYHLALADDRPVKPMRRGVTVAPKGGINLTVKELRQSETKAAAVL